MTLFSLTTKKELWTDERLYITEILNHAAIADFSVARGRVEPGVTTQLHTLDVCETYCVTGGQGRIEIDGQVHDMRPGDCATIAAGQAQRITNTGKSDLVIDLYCRPRFTPDTYHNLEKERGKT